MMGSKGRSEQVKAAADTVVGAVKSAGSLVVITLAVACCALLVALGAAVVAVRALRA
jgi:hypothetical protein